MLKLFFVIQLNDIKTYFQGINFFTIYQVVIENNCHVASNDE